jgi:hypothetical protein
MDAPTHDRGWIPEHASGDVVVLDASEPRRKRVGTTRVVLEDDLNPFERLSPTARKRLLVRVLCGLVVYDTADAVTDRLAG